MNPNPKRGVTRRDLLRAAAAAPLVAPAIAPRWRVPVRWLPGGDDRCVVVVELVGGNDGLNAVIPVDDERYARARPTLAAVRRGSHAVGDGFALHPALGPLAERIVRGQGAVVHGVGYRPPDRSHFRSRDIWHAADPTLREVTADTTGWLGRAADRLADAGAAVPGMSVGSLQVPLCLKSRRVVVPSLRRLEDYELLVDPAVGSSTADARRAALGELVRDTAGGDTAGGDPADDLLAFAAGIGRASLDAAERLRDALRSYRPRVAFPTDDFGTALALVAQVIVTGFGTRLFHLELAGFDTHSNQAPAHEGLLRQLARGLDAFVGELAAHGLLERTAILAHSEFGRRVAENQSHGTDHGAAAPAFVLGGGVRAGLHGEAPDLGDLDDGDLRVTCDFRRIYADLLGFVGLPARGGVDDVLGEHLEPIGLFTGR